MYLIFAHHIGNREYKHKRHNIISAQKFNNTVSIVMSPGFRD